MNQAAKLLSELSVKSGQEYGHDTRQGIIKRASAQCWHSRVYGTRSTHLYCFRDLSVLIVSTQSATAYDYWADVKKDSQK